MECVNEMQCSGRCGACHAKRTFEAGVSFLIYDKKVNHFKVIVCAT